jgi:hypothetical protein
MIPLLHVGLEDSRNGKLLQQLASGISFSQSSKDLHVNKVELLVQKSQASLALKVDHGSSASTTFLVDGKPWPFSRAATNVTTMRLALTDDVEKHVILCAVDSGMVLVQVDVCAYRVIEGPNGVFSAPKWARWQIQAAGAAVRAVIDRQTFERTQFDELARGIAPASDPGGDISHALHTASWNLASFAAGLTPSDLAPYHSAMRLGDVDVDRTRASLQRDMQRLQPTEDGPVVVSGRRYGTSFVEWRAEATHRLDLSAPITALEATIARLGHVKSSIAANRLLVEADRRLCSLSMRRGLTSRLSEVTAWLNAQLEGKAAQLRHKVVQTMRLTKAVIRIHQTAGGLEGLEGTFFDNRLFEGFCWITLWEALEGPPSFLRLSGRLDTKNGDVLIATGLPDGERQGRKLLWGWRDSSAMPARYKPDYIVKPRGSPAIIVDAKYRMGVSVDEYCEPGALKEVQAYLNEFSLRGGIILVPAIPESLAKGHHKSGVAVLEGTSKYGLQQIHIIEVAPGLEGTVPAIKNAIQKLSVLT